MYVTFQLKCKESNLQNLSVSLLYTDKLAIE